METNGANSLKSFNVAMAEPAPIDAQPAAKEILPSSPPPPVEKQRNLALDAYRGLIMILLVSDGFGFSELTSHPIYGVIANQFHHRPWGGAVFYDLIMPAFLFMVGVAMPYSLGRRLEEGADKRQLLKHVAKRCMTLVVVSWVLISIESKHAHIQFHNVIFVVAFTYFVCFFLMQLEFRYQAIAVLLLLVILG